MNKDPYAPIRLKNQLCFPLYAASKEIVRRYKPLLDELDLTYTQYIAMMVLWEQEGITVKELGRELMLDSGTLTPLLKKLEAKGYIQRTRMVEDERNVALTVTERGVALKDAALAVPEQMRSCIELEPEESAELLRILRKILAQCPEQE